MSTSSSGAGKAFIVAVREGEVEAGYGRPGVGYVWPLERYVSSDGPMTLPPARELFVVCPILDYGYLWLVAYLRDLRLEDGAWVPSKPNRLQIADITTFKTSLEVPGLAERGSGGALPSLRKIASALAVPAELSGQDEALLAGISGVRFAQGRSSPHHIEVAPTGRASCKTCGEKIPKLMLRFAEQGYNAYAQDAGFTFHHLACAAASRPAIFAEALAEHPGELPERAILLSKVARSRERQRILREGAAPPRRGGRGPDPVTGSPARGRDARELDREQYEGFIAELAASPDDAEARLVFADWLQSMGDPRGELVTLQNEISAEKERVRRQGSTEDDEEGAPTRGRRRRRRKEDAKPDDRFKELAEQERKLLATHEHLSPQLTDAFSLRWLGGFVDGLTLRARREGHVEELRRALSHPALALVWTLEVTSSESDLRPVVEVLVEDGGGALRALTLATEAWGAGHVGDLAPLLQRLSRLRELSLCACPSSGESFASESLFSLSLRVESKAAVQRMGALSGDQLPALRCLSAVFSDDRALRELIKAIRGVVPALEELALRGSWQPADVKALARVLKTRTHPLRVLDLSGGVAQDRATLRRTLEPHCLRLAVPETSVEESVQNPGSVGDGWTVVHKKRPQWGRGEVVKEVDGKLEINFENAGTKVIRADLGLLETV